MQGEIYGIHSEDTGAAFSSRFHASSGTPGIRCHCLSAPDKGNESLRAVIEQENPRIRWDDLKTGDLVAVTGGEMFVCLNRKGSTTCVHADINAAQNLQRRFWTRHADAFRVVCRLIVVNGEQRWVPRGTSKRLFGALGGYGWLVPTDGVSYRWESITSLQWKNLGWEMHEEGRADDGWSVIEDASEVLLKSSGKVQVFFRDPSGVVFPSEFWNPCEIFWGQVKVRTAAVMSHVEVVWNRYR